MLPSIRPCLLYYSLTKVTKPQRQSRCLTWMIFTSESECVGLAEKPSQASVFSRRLLKIVTALDTRLIMQQRGAVAAVAEGCVKHKGWLLVVPVELCLMPTSSLHNDTSAATLFKSHTRWHVWAAQLCNGVIRAGTFFHGRASPCAARRFPHVFRTCACCNRGKAGVGEGVGFFRIHPVI